jgi:hypothetical protein
MSGRMSARVSRAAIDRGCAQPSRIVSRAGSTWTASSVPSRPAPAPATYLSRWRHAVPRARPLPSRLCRFWGRSVPHSMTACYPLAELAETWSAQAGGRHGVGRIRRCNEPSLGWVAMCARSAERQQLPAPDAAGNRTRPAGPIRGPGVRGRASVRDRSVPTAATTRFRSVARPPPIRRDPDPCCGGAAPSREERPMRISARLVYTRINSTTLASDSSPRLRSTKSWSVRRVSINSAKLCNSACTDRLG